MAILSWRTADGEAGEIQLREGALVIGREEGNDCVVPDASVSSRHCEAVVQNGGLVIRDLGSTNGTYVEGQRVGQALIEPGRNFKLGAVEFCFRAPAAQPAMRIPAATVKPPTPGIRIATAAPIAAETASMEPDPAEAPLGELAVEPSAPATGVCFQHPVSPATHTCEKCSRDLCGACVKLEQIGPKRVPFCRHCGGKCVTYGTSLTPQIQRRATFFEMLPGAFAYPFKGNGLLLLFTGTIFFGFLDTLTSAIGVRVFLILGALIIVNIIMYGYLFAYMQKIVRASAEGEDEPPSWPEVTDIGSDIFHPCWLFLATTAAAFVPGFLLTGFSPAAGFALLGLGMLYFPMALLAVAMSDSLSGLNPLIVVSAALKVPGPYLVAAIVCGVLVVVRGIVPNFFTLPVVSNFVLAPFWLIIVMIEMRVLGILYYTNREKFGWF